MCRWPGRLRPGRDKRDAEARWQEKGYGGGAGKSVSEKREEKKKKKKRVPAIWVTWQMRVLDIGTTLFLAVAFSEFLL